MKVKGYQPFWLTVFLLLIKLYIAKVAFSAFGCKTITQIVMRFFQGCAWLMEARLF